MMAWFADAYMWNLASMKYNLTMCSDSLLSDATEAIVGVPGTKLQGP